MLVRIIWKEKKEKKKRIFEGMKVSVSKFYLLMMDLSFLLGVGEWGLE